MQTNLDVKRLLCPMPVIRLGEMIEKIEIGDTIQIIATDPGVLHDTIIRNPLFTHLAIF
jgi:tRNA 2-thiouridine synthesizing protein A